MSLFDCNRVVIPSVVTSRPTTGSRLSNPLNPSPLAPQIRLLLTTVRVYKLYLLILTDECSVVSFVILTASNIVGLLSRTRYLQCFDAVGWAAGRASGL